MHYINLYIIFAMLATIWLDVTRYTIPNWLVGSLLFLYPVALYMTGFHADWKMAIVAFLVVFAVGYAVFAAGIMGGGDVKLIAALALWVGWWKLLDFVLMFALLGGALSVLLIVLRKIRLYMPWKERFKTPCMLQKDAPIPYGVAIAGSFLWMMSKGLVPVLPTLSF